MRRTRTVTEPGAARNKSRSKVSISTRLIQVKTPLYKRRKKSINTIKSLNNNNSFKPAIMSNMLKHQSSCDDHIFILSSQSNFMLFINKLH